MQDVILAKIRQAAERYPDLNDVIELAAHHEENTPIHRICAFLANFVADVIKDNDTAPVENDGNESE